MGQSHSFEQAREDGSAFRFASSETEGGSDQFAQAGGMEGQQSDRQPMGSQPNDPGTGQFGQTPMGDDRRRDEMITGGGGSSSF